MRVTLSVVAGPHAGRDYHFDCHSTFLVGRAAECHFRFDHADPYFSRRHFLIEVNPPRCRVTDLNSRNGIRVNGRKVLNAELVSGDEVQAGQAVFKVSMAGTTVAPVSATEPSIVGPVFVPDRLPIIPGFLIKREIGRGGMGAVYRARRLSDNRRVAVKTVLPNATADRRDIDRFLREASILEQLDHPNVVKHLGSGSHGPLLYIVMEFVNGPHAQRVVEDRGPLRVRTGIKLICQALDGLAHAHDLGFVHRDIKPSNLLLGKSGAKRVVKVADFGLARAYKDARLSDLTMLDDIRGTPPFMAPDQIINFRETKPAADQYSAAATLYWILTEKFPFDFSTGDRFRILAKVLSEDPVPIRKRRADVPNQVAAVIERAMSPEPEKRYESVAAFRDELHRLAVKA